VVYLGGGIRFEMVWIPAGEFMMAASKSMAQHNVKLTTGFWMGKYEVTQEQWKRIMGDNPTLFKGTRLPVGGLNWNHAHDFITKLNETVRSSRDIASSEEFRFPTEAEWEYACRAGKPAQFYAGNQDDDPDSICWHRDNSECRLHPVGEKKPNAWGLYDTYGNVNELCYDYETEGTWPAAPAVDPTGPSRADGCKIARGGDGRTSWDFCLVERDISMPWWPRIFTGLRLAFGKPIVQP
jgi:formylglycine-generating enzyme required for sulfatase activity